MLANDGNINIEVEVLVNYASNLVKSNNSKKLDLLENMTNLCKDAKIFDTDDLFSKLNSFKEPLKKINDNLNMLDKTLDLLKQIEANFSSDLLQNKLDNYNDFWDKNNNIIFENYLFAQDFLDKKEFNNILPDTSVVENEELPIEKSTNIEPPKTVDTKLVEDINIEQDKIANQVIEPEPSIDSTDTNIDKAVPVEDTTDSLAGIVTIQTNEPPKIDKDNNTLLISEIKGKVFLPYKLSDLEEIVKYSDEQYDNIESLVEDKYVFPIEKYRFPVVSRFKEAFHLMRDKEHASFISSFNLGTELAKNSLLNPAVIAACKNIDELDIYLDYLANNKLDQFDIFNVEYEMLPLKV